MQAALADSSLSNGGQMQPSLENGLAALNGNIFSMQKADADTSMSPLKVEEHSISPLMLGNGGLSSLGLVK